MSRKQQGNFAEVTVLIVVTLCGGCAPIGGTALETIVREFALGAAAAFLL